LAVAVPIVIARYSKSSDGGPVTRSRVRLRSERLNRSNRVRFRRTQPTDSLCRPVAPLGSVSVHDAFERSLPRRFSRR